MSSQCRRCGLVVDRVDDVSKKYAAAIGTKQVFEFRKFVHWRQLGAWLRGDRGRLEIVLSLTERMNPYVGYAHDKYGTKVIAVTPDGWAKYFDYDAILKPWELGWGVDKERFRRVADNRRGASKPSFHMLSRDESVEHRLSVLGYDVHYGDAYYLSQVGLEPKEVFVPIRVYEAAASGMPVVSVRANEGWTRPLGVYNDLFIDQSVDAVARSVSKSDFLYAGMIARDMVPGLSDFSEHIRGLLNTFE